MRYLTTLLVCTSVVVYTLYSLIIAFDIPFDDFPITKQEVGAEMRTKAAKYEPSLAPMERKLVKELSTILAPLNEGTQKVLELDAAKQRLAEQRQERDTAAKKALERAKNQTNYRSGRLGGRSSSSASSGKPLGSKSSYGGGYDAYAPFPGSYGGFSDYHTGYGDYGSTHPAPLSSRTAKADEQSPTNSLLTNTKNESTTTEHAPGGYGIDMAARKEAETRRKQAQKYLHEAMTQASAIQDAARTAHPGTAYDDAITRLRDSDTFRKLLQATDQWANYRTAELDALAAKPPTTSGATPKTTPSETFIKESDTQLASAYRGILAPVMYAATRDGDTIADAMPLLRGDMSKLLGKDAITAAAKKRAMELYSTWPEKSEFEQEKKFLAHGTNLAFIKTTKPGAPAPAAARAAVPPPPVLVPGAPAALPTALRTIHTAAGAAGGAAVAYTDYKNYLGMRANELKEMRKRFSALGIKEGDLDVLDRERQACEGLLRDLDS